MFLGLNAFSLLIIVSGIVNYRPDGAGAPQGAKDAAVPLHVPQRRSHSAPAQEIIAGVLQMGIFFPFLDRAYSSPLIQRPRQSEPGRLVDLFLFCKKACVQGKALNYRFARSLGFKLVTLAPTL